MFHEFIERAQPLQMPEFPVQSARQHVEHLWQLLRLRHFLWLLWWSQPLWFGAGREYEHGNL